MCECGTACAFSRLLLARYVLSADNTENYLPGHALKQWHLPPRGADVQPGRPSVRVFTCVCSVGACALRDFARVLFDCISYGDAKSICDYVNESYNIYFFLCFQIWLVHDVSSIEEKCMKCD